MNIAISEASISSPAMENFTELEKLLGTRLYSINLKQVTSELEALNQGSGEPGDSRPFGIVINVDDNPGALKKIWSLLHSAKKAREIITKLNRSSGKNYVAYGVYPEIYNPVSIYQLNSPAEDYANRFFLPPIQNGLNGFLRRIIFNIIRFHPSTAGIIILNKEV